MFEPSPQINTLTRQVIGAAMEVHSLLGPGYLEQVYHRAMEIELARRRMPFQSQVPIDIRYKGEALGTTFRFDLVVDGLLLVELKAVERIAPIHVAQVIGYLKATELTLGLIINFHVVLLRDGVRRVLPPPRVHCAP